MNVLSFISAILIIFSIITASILHQHKDSVEIKKSVYGYYAASESSREALEKAFFKNIKNKPKEPKKNKSEEEASSSQIVNPKQPIEQIECNENEKQIYQCAMLNILSLLSEGKDAKKDIYEIFAQIIRSFYKDLLLPKEEYLLIDNLIKKAKIILDIKEEELVLEKIVLDDSMQQVWYQMQKGSKFYEYKKKIGYPSILEFITISKNEDAKNQSTICLQKASREMLSALFNEQIAEEIIKAKKSNTSKNTLENSKKKEKAKNYLTKNDLDTILAKHNFQLKNNLSSYFSFSHNNHKKIPIFLICWDEKTKISIKKKCEF